MFYQTAIFTIIALSCFIYGSTSSDDTTAFRRLTFPTKRTYMPPYSEDTFLPKPLTYVSKSERFTRDTLTSNDDVGTRRSTSNPIPSPIHPGNAFNPEIGDSGRSKPVRPGYFPKLEQSQRLARDLHGEKIPFPAGGFNQKATIDGPVGDNGYLGGWVSQNFDSKGFSGPQKFGVDAALKNDGGSLYGGVSKTPSHGGEAHIGGKITIVDTPDHKVTGWVEHSKPINRRRRQIGPPRPPVYRPPPRTPLFKHRF